MVADKTTRPVADCLSLGDCLKMFLAAGTTLGTLSIVAIVLRGVLAADATPRDCVGETLWGGNNGTTTYTTVSYPGMGNQLLAQSRGASLPVQSMPHGMINVPQTTVPGMGIGGGGAVGSVGYPATSQSTILIDHLPPGSVIRFARPISATNSAAVGSNRGEPLSAWEIVPEGTPGAVAVTVKETMVYRPVIETHCVFGPVTHTATSEKRLVDPRTGRVIKRWMVTEDVPSWLVPVPIFHREERTVLKPVRVQVVTPLPVAPVPPTSRADLFRTNEVLFTPVADTIPIIPVASFSSSTSPFSTSVSYPPVFMGSSEVSSRLTTSVVP